MSALGSGTLSVLCVDDNVHVAEALRVKLARTPDFRWQGWLANADELVERAEQERPSIVLMDLDMPGKDPFEAIAEILERRPEVKVVVFSGHVRRELIERAVDVGVWGYVSKNDGEDALLIVLRRVAVQEFAMSPEVRSTWLD